MTLERVKLVVEELRAARAGPEDVADAVELLLEVSHAHVAYVSAALHQPFCCLVNLHYGQVPTWV